MMRGSSSSKPEDLLRNLHHALNTIAEHSSPHIPNPEGCRKRASVACIIRFRPRRNANHRDQPAIPAKPKLSEQLQLHFAQEWVQDSEPEVLFIRRAARKGDRWTSQVALPGGKRDPDDTSDLATSAREAKEEVGLDLNSNQVLYVGKLPERVITTEWGTTPLMVLCPFVYLLTQPKTPQLVLQPDEIASTHWVPVRVLLTPSLWTYESADASDRFAKQGGPLMKLVFRLVVGHMLFGAVRLLPSESQLSGHVPTGSSINRSSQHQRSGLVANQTDLVPKSLGTSEPLLLWGLTHGIIIDLLQLLPDSGVLQSWRWPTFSAYDVRLIVWMISRGFRQRKLQGVHKDPEGPFFVVEEGLAACDRDRDVGPNDGVTDVRHSTKSLKSDKFSSPSLKTGNQHSAVHYMLHGYFELIQKSIFLSLAMRIGVAAAIIAFALRRQNQG